MVGHHIASRKSDELITSALEERIRNQRQGVYLYSNMRKANLSERHIERFIADHKVQVEKESDRVVARYERLKTNPDAVSLATN